MGADQFDSLEKKREKKERKSKFNQIENKEEKSFIFFWEREREKKDQFELKIIIKAHHENQKSRAE